MQSATASGVPSPLLMRLRALPATTWAKLGFGGLCVIALVGFLLFPTYPIYDSEYYLLWGREILHLHTPSFAAYDAPTEHPLAVAYATVLAIFGNASLRIEVLSSIVSFLILARVAFAPAVGAVAVLLLCTRFNLVFLAIRGYVDITFLAAIVWAAALEVEHPRRGTPVFALLAVAELIRPDAWLLAGLYWLWCFPHASWGERLRWAAFCAIGPAAWAGLDMAVTGDPLWSLHATNNLAVALNRTVPVSGVPAATGKYLVGLIKGPLVAGGVAGVLLAAWFVPKRMWMSLVILATGIVMFALIAAAGLSVIDRYLLLPSVMLLAFCAFTLSGWTMLEAGVVRRAWAIGALILALYAVASYAKVLSVGYVESELGFRDSGHTSLVAILNKPAVRRELHCGPVSVPNHKLIPDTRWILDAPASGVIARSQADGRPRLEARIRYGVAIYALNLALTRYALVEPTDNPLDNVPPPGYRRIWSTAYFAAYARCPS